MTTVADTTKPLVISSFPKDLNVGLCALTTYRDRRAHLHEAMLGALPTNAQTNAQFTGLWLSTVRAIFAETTPETLSVNDRLFKDEFMDNGSFELGKAGKWLRRRYYSAELPMYTLKYSVPDPTTGLLPQDVNDIADIQSETNSLDVDVDFPFIVASYDCLRLQFETFSGTTILEMVRLTGDLFYILATAVRAGTLRHGTHQFHTRGKMVEALRIQNNMHYQYLLVKGVVGRLEYEADDTSHIRNPRQLMPLFGQFSNSFYCTNAELSDEDEGDDDEGTL